MPVINLLAPILFAGKVTLIILFYGAISLLLFSFGTIVVPYAINLGIRKFTNFGVNRLIEKIGTDSMIFDNVIEVTGFLAWLCDKMQIPECIAVILSGLLAYLTIRGYKSGINFILRLSGT